MIFLNLGGVCRAKNWSKIRGGQGPRILLFARGAYVASSGQFEMGYERGNSKINVNVENHENSMFSDHPHTPTGHIVES